MMQVYVEGVGLCGPGLDGWTASLPVLTAMRDYLPAPIHVAPSALLPANERRRAVQTVRLVLAVGAEAFAAAGRDAAETATVFTSSGGDGDTIHAILCALVLPDREVSPTRFHNSVHNAPAGYWSIATGSQAASSSLCCHDDSFAAGLLEAAVRASTDRAPVAVMAYDVPYPSPIGDVRVIDAPFAVALVLSPVPTAAAFASLEIDLRTGRAGAALPRAGLERLLGGTPAARCLPLLAALAANATAAVALDYLNDMVLTVNVAPMAGDGRARGNPLVQAGG